MTTDTQAPRAHPLCRIAIAAATVAAMAAVFAYATASTPQAAPAKAAGEAVPVSLASVVQQDFPIWTDAIGTVTSLNAVNVRSRVDGQLERVAFTEGQMVRKGDLLAQVDPRPLQAQVNQTRAVLAQEDARLSSNKIDLQRAIELAAAGAGSTQAVDTLRATVATQAAVVQAAQAALDSAQLQLGFTRITSPSDGRVGQRLQPAGSTVHANDAVGIATVTQMNPIWVAFSVPQDQLPAVTQQSQARALKVQALLRDRSRVLADGELEFVDSQVSPAAGQVQLKARFANADRALWPGQLVSVRMLLSTQAEATVVPPEAVQQGPKGAFVYVVDGQHMAQARQIDAGPISQGLQWVRKGLQPGDTVVTQGQYRIAPGIQVMATTADSSAPAKGQ
ncbi:MULTISPECIES: efflux RND transporter periplasmic adaptor subunit [unclassified Acidovorax]|uniref:efflux RND transporter periplasmic adaptor subunit n=1 Tax=unclassified Acidovorax TaxID=2684926 RepID=UPI0023DE386E|nr:MULTISPECIES: efflux RND transporter periplasmic adaptor subunit [unclassified Acidovorax]GKS92836.1 efflux RND transporter periplasmic adaptor subunit [Acidovorax sp. SUPP2539]GKS97560.1 efflux RND transporter periplasmic adaptor subunit [Acidovorax sp. SUPP2825]